jgi:hypothetical protein
LPKIKYNGKTDCSIIARISVLEMEIARMFPQNTFKIAIVQIKLLCKMNKKLIQKVYTGLKIYFMIITFKLETKKMNHIKKLPKKLLIKNLLNQIKIGKALKGKKNNKY